MLKLTKIKKVILVGNPNVGKSVIFNKITGKYATVSNFPGTTVDYMKGRYKTYEVYDTPGCYSILNPMSEDEAATRKIVMDTSNDDVICIVMEAKNLKRGLQLVYEMWILNKKCVVALNMYDEIAGRIDIDIKKLQEFYGIPFVKTIAIESEGIEQLKAAFDGASIPKVELEVNMDIEFAIKKLGFDIKEGIYYFIFPEKSDLQGKINEVKSKFITRFEVLLMIEIQQSINKVINQVFIERRKSYGFLDSISKLLYNPIYGLLSVIVVLYVLYIFVGVFGAGTLVELLEERLFNGVINPFFIEALKFLPDGVYRFFVGEYGIITMAITYAFALILPIVTTFFFAFSILEDSGYLPRLAFILDRVMKIMGLNGKSVVPLVLGLGCDTMATITTRILESEKQKLIATILLTLSIPCSAQLGVIMAMLAGYPNILIMWLLVIVFTTLIIGFFSSLFLPGFNYPFLYEIPPLRFPDIRNIYFKVSRRLKWYLYEATPMFIIGTNVLFILNETGLLNYIKNFMTPFVKVLGLPIESASSILIGFLRRDYGAAGFYDMANKGLLSEKGLLVASVLITLLMPCFAQVMAVFRERGFIKGVLIVLFVLFYAFLASYVVSMI
ncbi:MAG: ferrous iron transport protein B [bacterium]|nr:ferrous iron transport protein B [bacterium]